MKTYALCLSTLWRRGYVISGKCKPITNAEYQSRGKTKMATNREAVKQKKQMTSKQQEMLLELVLARPKLLVGKLDKHFTNADRKAGWVEIAEVLNASGTGPTKSHEKWNKCLNDYKMRLKGKAATIGKSRRLTGGGEGTKLELTKLEERFLYELVGPTAIHGDQNTDELGVELETSRANDLISRIDIVNQQDYVIPRDAEVVPVVNEDDPTAGQQIMEINYLPEQAVRAFEQLFPENTTAPAGIQTKIGKKRKRVLATESTLVESVRAANQIVEERKRTSESTEAMAASIQKMAEATERQAAGFERMAAAMEKLVEILYNKY